MYKVYGDWRKLRTKIYQRDEGICWVCGQFTNLKDYNLGHLVDRVMGGVLDPVNLAVMHSSCNMSKPKHKTRKQAIEWRDKVRSEPKVIKTPKVILLPSEKEQIKHTIVNYFLTHKYLLDGKVNHQRSEAIRQLSEQYKISIVLVRQYIVEAGLVEPKLVSKNPERYTYISNNIQELYSKYCNIKHKRKLTQIAEELNMSTYGIDIMLYLSGHPKKVMPNNLHAISKRVKELGIKITPISEKCLELGNDYCI